MEFAYVCSVEERIRQIIYDENTYIIGSLEVGGAEKQLLMLSKELKIRDVRQAVFVIK